VDRRMRDGLMSAEKERRRREEGEVLFLGAGRE
jgi:hypothetical protein